MEEEGWRNRRGGERLERPCSNYEKQISKIKFDPSKRTGIVQFIPFADHLVYFFASNRDRPPFSPGFSGGSVTVLAEKSTGVDRPIRVESAGN